MIYIIIFIRTHVARVCVWCVWCVWCVCAWPRVYIMSIQIFTWHSFLFASAFRFGKMAYLFTDIYDWYRDLMDNKSGMYLIFFHDFYIFRRYLLFTAENTHHPSTYMLLLCWFEYCAYGGGGIISRAAASQPASHGMASSARLWLLVVSYDTHICFAGQQIFVGKIEKFQIYPSEMMSQTKLCDHQLILLLQPKTKQHQQ